MRSFPKKFLADALLVLGIFLFLWGIVDFKASNRGPSSSLYWYANSTQLQIASGASMIALGVLWKKHLKQ